ncbi:MAG: hypothetical protein AUH69_06670 [Actinobacteria bacterium 13_1_40CM_4_65_12]|nr:MAG: hypothetical protein AUH69_06670 [Actinobacteria bacterium 13_1_40CM_4_65_12]
MSRPVIGITFATLVLACGDTLGPVTGPYEMTFVDSVEVPHVVAATLVCDELVLRGSLALGTKASFLLQVTQAQDCARAGGTIDTFTTTLTGSFFLNGTKLTLRPAGTGLTYSGVIAPGAVELQLPPLPFLTPPQHSAKFVKFPL